MGWGWPWSDDDMQADSERMKVYAICRERGHEGSGHTLTSNPPWSVCKYCNTAFRYERVLRELSGPASRAEGERT